MSMSGQNDRCLPVEALSTRYSIGKTAVYTRLKALGIQPEKVGNRAYVIAAQIALLDALLDHIQAGGITPVFLKDKGLHPYGNLSSPQDSDGQSVELSSGLILNQSDVGKLARAIAAELTALFRKSA